MSEELIMTYMDRLVEEVFGKESFRQILDVLGSVENGYCGCEMYYSTFPRLLATRGIDPIRTYTSEYGKPPEDGRAAATPKQRELILEALNKAGFPV